MIDASRYPVIAAKAAGVPVHMLLEARGYRSRKVSRARWCGVRVAYEDGHSIRSIHEAFNMDRTAVIYALKRQGVK